MGCSGLVLGCLLLAQIQAPSPPTGSGATGLAPIPDPQDAFGARGQPSLDSRGGPNDQDRGLQAGGRQASPPLGSIDLLSPSGTRAPAPTTPLISAISKGHRATPSELVPEALRLPAGASLIGQPVGLLDALASARGRSQQLDVIRAYWRLALALGEYRLRLDESELLRRLVPPRAEDPAVLRSARASAAADQRRAELDAIRAQHALAETAGLSASLPAPLPADLPHVGPYETKFERLSASRTLPPKARLIDRTLSIRLEAVEKRAAAVQAAEDALEAVADLYGRGQGELWTYLACLADCAHQRRALLTEACQYNEEIADYALSAAGSAVTAQELVGMLLKQPTAGPQPNRIQPSRAQPAGSVPDRQGPTPAPPRKSAPPAGSPPLSPTADRDSALPESQPAGAARREVSRMNLDRPAAPGSSLALYPALTTAAPDLRAKYISQELHSPQRPLPQPGQAISLRDCLAAIPASLRRPVLDAYWLACQRAAECRTLLIQQDQLAQLAPIAMEHGSRPSGAAEGLRLHAASLATAADLCDARVRLVDAQFELTRLLARPLDKAWLLPGTSPHAGPYLLNLQAQPPQVARSPAVERLAAIVPALWESLQQRATAVVEADSARAAAAAAYQSGTRPLDQLLPCLRFQTMETLALVETVTAYNRAIAEYVLTVVPAGISADQLVQTLVVAN